MSYEYAYRLRQRAKRYLESAKDNFKAGRYDIAGLEAEISAQLILKGYIVYLGLEFPRTHSIRALLSFIVSKDIMSEDIADKLKDFARTHRNELIILERAREAGQYSFIDIDKDEAEVCLKIADKLFSIIEDVWR